jgi:hypothetical protein
MPTESEFKLNFYWGDRREDDQACARRLARMVSGLSDLDPSFARWLDPSQKELSSKLKFSMPPEVDQLARLFDANRSYKDYPPDKLWPEMGFWLLAWNGQKKSLEAGFVLNVGRYDSNSGVPNHVELHLGQNSVATGRPWQGSQVRSILKVIVEAWDVQYVWVKNDPLRDLLPREQHEHGITQLVWPMPGWVTYLRAPYSLCVQPPPDIAVERLPDGAMIATLCEEPFDAKNPRHGALLASMNQAMAPVQKIWKWDE